MNNKLSLLVNFVGVDKLSGSLRNIVGLGKKGSRSLGALRGEGRRLEAQMRKVRSEIAGSSGNITELADREKELERAIDGVNSKLERQKRLNAIEGDRRAMLARGESLKSRGRDNMMQGASLAAPLIFAAKSAADFSSGMVDIQQKTGIADAEADKLAGRIMLMSRDARQMPEDIRSGLDVLLAKGMGLGAAEAAIGPAGRIATAYKVEIPDAAGAAFAAISNLKVPARETSRIFDMMAAAGNEGAFEVRDMARHFPSLTAQMQALGEKGAPAVADLSAALQVAMKTAGSEDEAGNNIKNLLAKINAPATVRAFKKNFGVDLPAAMKKFTDQGYSSMEAIALVTKEATGGDMKKLGYAFEDMQARQGIMALIQNLDEYRRIRSAAMESDGTVDSAFDQRVLRDASVSWTAFLSTLSSLGTTLGTTLLPVLTQALGYVNGLLSRFSAWAQANPRTASTLMKIVAGLAVFKIGLGAAQFALGGLLGPLANGIALFRRLGGVATIFTTLRTAALFMAKGVMRAGLMMLANPIVLIIAAIALAIGAAAYLIYTHWDTIKAAFNAGVAALGQAWSWVKTKFTEGVNFVLSLHGRMLDIGRNIIIALAQGIRSAPGAVWNALKSVVGNGIERVKNFLGIKSPSRVFMAIGGHTAEGMALGIEKRGSRAVAAAGRLAAGVTGAASFALTPVGAAASPAASARPAASTAPVGGGPASITIHVHAQPGQDTRALARQVKRELEGLYAIDHRSSYEDGL